MSKQNAMIKMIPVERVNILNPRVRNPKMFDAIVQNIAKVGLKRPYHRYACALKSGRQRLRFSLWSGSAGSIYGLRAGNDTGRW